MDAYQKEILAGFRSAVLAIPIKDLEKHLNGYRMNIGSNLKHYKIPGGMELEVCIDEPLENSLYLIRRVAAGGPETELAEFSESSPEIDARSALSSQEAEELKKYTEGLLQKKSTEAEGAMK